MVTTLVVRASRLPFGSAADTPSPRASAAGLFKWTRASAADGHDACTGPRSMAVVLVVNDDPDMLDLYAAVLEDMGHHAVLRVEPDPEPDTLLEAGADALVIDLQAEADPMAGMCAIEILRSSPATQAFPIILATAASPREMQPIAERLEDLRVRVLRKPFGIDRFQDVLGRVLPFK